MFEHLLADHDVELALDHERGAQVEVGIVQALERGPGPFGVGTPADLGRIELLGPELIQIFTDGLVHLHP